MQQELLILPVVLPILFWAAYHYHKDRHLPEPAVNLVLCFALGLVAAGISKALYLGLEPLGLRMDAVALGEDQPLALLAYAVLAIGPIEEFAKFLPFVIVVLRFEHFDEPLDGIIYASFIALGYAAVENLYYLQFLTVPEAIARGFVGPVIHVLFASIWAYWITRAHLARRSSVRAALLGLLLSSGLHGVYDFLVLLQPVAALPAGAGLIAAIWIWRLRLMRRMQQAANQTR
jgi:protease PrsW